MPVRFADDPVASTACVSHTPGRLIDNVQWAKPDGPGRAAPRLVAPTDDTASVFGPPSTLASTAASSASPSRSPVSSAVPSSAPAGWAKDWFTETSEIVSTLGSVVGRSWTPATRDTVVSTEGTPPPLPPRHYLYAPRDRYSSASRSYLSSRPTFRSNRPTASSVFSRPSRATSYRTSRTPYSSRYTSRPSCSRASKRRSPRPARSSDSSALPLSEFKSTFASLYSRYGPPESLAFTMRRSEAPTFMSTLQSAMPRTSRFSVRSSAPSQRYSSRRGSSVTGVSSRPWASSSYGSSF